MTEGIAKAEEVVIQYEFSIKDNQQKIWIDALLKYSGLCLSTFASILDVPVHTLQAIHNGSLFFIGEDANNLAIVFLTYFGGITSNGSNRYSKRDLDLKKTIKV